MKRPLTRFAALGLILLTLGLAAPAFPQDKAPQSPVHPEIAARVELVVLDLVSRLVPEDLDNPAKTFAMLKDFLKKHPYIFGAAWAAKPQGKGENKKLHSLYVYRRGDALIEVNPEGKYDYTASTEKWYWSTIRNKMPTWSPPYYDTYGAGEQYYMTTFAVPLYTNDRFSNFVGVITGDVLLQKVGN